MGQAEKKPAEVGGVAGERVKSFIERVERLEAEKQVIADDIKEVYAEASTVGFDAKVLRSIVKARKIDREKRAEQLELFDLYTAAAGFDLEPAI